MTLVGIWRDDVFLPARGPGYEIQEHDGRFVVWHVRLVIGAGWTGTPAGVLGPEWNGLYEKGNER